MIFRCSRVRVSEMRNHRLFSLAALASAAACFPSYAAAQSFQTNSDPCQISGSMVDTSICMQKALERADVALNEMYKKPMPVLEPYEKTALRKAQRSWIAYRDLECEAEATLYNGGSGKGLIRQSCLYSITIDRLASLDR